jgi:hypothetical protein
MMSLRRSPSVARRRSKIGDLEAGRSGIPILLLITLKTTDAERRRRPSSNGRWRSAGGVNRRL